MQDEGHQNILNLLSKVSKRAPVTTRIIQILSTPNYTVWLSRRTESRTSITPLDSFPQTPPRYLEEQDRVPNMSEGEIYSATYSNVGRLALVHRRQADPFRSLSTNSRLQATMSCAEDRTTGSTPHTFSRSQDSINLQGREY